MTVGQETVDETATPARGWGLNTWDSPWLNFKFLLGVAIVGLILLFGLLGPLFWDTDLAYTGAGPLNKPPVWQEGGWQNTPWAPRVTGATCWRS